MTTDYQLTILLALQRMGKHIYQGTVAPEVVENRRAKNKAARAARKVSRS